MQLDCNSRVCAELAAKFGLRRLIKTIFCSYQNRIERGAYEPLPGAVIGDTHERCVTRSMAIGIIQKSMEQTIYVRFNIPVSRSLSRRIQAGVYYRVTSRPVIRKSQTKWYNHSVVDLRELTFPFCCRSRRNESLLWSDC